MAIVYMHLKDWCAQEDIVMGHARTSRGWSGIELSRVVRVVRVVLENTTACTGNALGLNRGMLFAGRESRSDISAAQAATHHYTECVYI